MEDLQHWSARIPQCNSAVAADLLVDSPENDRAYKHREFMIDAIFCAWTAMLWHRHGRARCQALGVPRYDGTLAPAIIARAEDDQRRRDGQQ